MSYNLSYHTSKLRERKIIYNMKTNTVNKVPYVARIIKSSLAMVIPVLFIGSVSVLLSGFPLQAYQDFLDCFLGGAPRKIIITVLYSTSGILAIHLTVALNISFMNQNGERHSPAFRLGSLLSCLTGYVILVGFFSGEPDFSLLSGQGVFSALLAGIFGSILFKRFAKAFKTPKMILVEGADSEFNASLHMILLYLSVTLCFAAFNYLITVCFQVQSVQHLFMKIMDAIFLRMQRSYLSGLLFVSLASVLWWFGIHGNNVLDKIAVSMFTTIIPGQIVSKTFIDIFVNMGGTGCTIGLLIALFIFGRTSSTKKLSKMALFPCIFNISEMLTFGFPVMYNPLMALPFILAPMLCYSNAYILTITGFLPEVASEVVWTVPALFSGYLATGSARAVIVQLLNILISTACYAPFVIICEKRASNQFSNALEGLVSILKKCEETTEDIVLTECEGNAGRLAKRLAVDLDEALTKSSPDKDLDGAESPLIIKYQPQFDNTGKCIGAEALLRWEHVQFGTVYPPLVVKVAKESGILYNLETYIIEKAILESAAFRKCYGESFKLSVNTTVTTLYDRKFPSFLQSMVDRYRLKAGNICIEITEETELVTTEETGELIKRIRALGYTFALDDFSMGHTSLQYLQHNQFDLVKLDGNLVKSILTNDRTKEIINSIVYLSKSLDFKVLAEYVETKEQKDALEANGCLLYQGYLFSPAVNKDTLVQMAQSKLL